jgi:hypothetical protein
LHDATNGARLALVLGKKHLGGVALVMALGAVAVAQGAVVQEFGFQVKDVKADGRYTVIFDSRSYDSSGGVPDRLTANYIRLPKGATFRKQFAKQRYYCDLRKLVDQLRSTHPNAPHFDDLVNQTLRGRPVPPRNAHELIAVCRFAHVGGGTALIDARPFVEESIPAHFEMFWAKPGKGAVATFAIVGSADESSPVVQQNPTIRDTHPILSVDFVDDPTPDGVYGYRLSLPVGPIGGINVSFAQVHAVTRGLSLPIRKTRCVKRRRGRCVKHNARKTNIFFLTRPTCPRSAELSFQASYLYASGSSETKTISIPCPTFGI